MNKGGSAPQRKGSRFEAAVVRGYAFSPTRSMNPASRGKGSWRPKVSEKSFSQQIFDLARYCGWKVARFPTWRATSTMPGFPDLVLVRAREQRQPRLIFAELKRDKEERGLSLAQEEWITELQAIALCCQTVLEVYVWDWGDWEEIVGVLR